LLVVLHGGNSAVVFLSDITHLSGGGTADGGGDVGPLVGTDADESHVVDVVGLEKDSVGSGESDLIVDNGDVGGKVLNVEGAETEDLVSGGQKGEVVVVLLVFQSISENSTTGCAGSLDNGLSLVEEGVVHVDTGVLESGGGVGTGIGVDIEDDGDDDTDLDIGQLGANGIDEHVGTSQGRSGCVVSDFVDGEGRSSGVSSCNCSGISRSQSLISVKHGVSSSVSECGGSQSVRSTDGVELEAHDVGVKDELFIGGGGAVQIVVGRTSIDVSASVVSSRIEAIRNLRPDGIGHHGSGDVVGEGSSHADWTSPNIVAVRIAIDGFEGSRDGQPGKLDAAPGGGESACRVVVVHREVHLGVSVREDHLVHDQGEVLLGRRGLDTGNGESWEDFGEGAQVELSERDGVWGLGDRGHGNS
jgi:hypothetical protein